MSTSKPADRFRTTLHDVAAAAGVSAMTVSRALNGKGKVSDETRARIVKLARDLGYQPSQAARSLRTSESRIIGMIHPNLRMPLHIDITQGAKDALLAHGYRIMFDVYTSTEHDLAHVTTDGDLLLGNSVTYQDVPLPVATRNRTVTLLGGILPGDMRYKVDDCHTNLAEVIFEATMHLLEQGYRKIALLQLPRSPAGAEYERAHRELGLEWDPEHLRTMMPETSPIAREMEHLVSMHNRPDAFLMAAVAATPVALRTLRRLGFVLPNDFGFVGIESRSSEFGDLVFPGITCIRIPGYEIGMAGAKRLLDRIRGDDGPRQQIVVLSELLVRATTPGPRTR